MTAGSLTVSGAAYLLDAISGSFQLLSKYASSGP